MALREIDLNISPIEVDSSINESSSIPSFPNSSSNHFSFNLNDEILICEHAQIGEGLADGAPSTGTLVTLFLFC